MTEPTFSRFADDYNFWIRHASDPEALTRVARLARGQERVLDVGCGDGLLTVELARVAQQVVGVDLSPTMIDLARQRATDEGCQNVEFIQADINELEMAHATFDLIVSSFALHHTDPRVTVPALVQLLRPGGMIYLQEPVCPVTGLWARRLWYRRQGLHKLLAIVQRYGLQTAWRVTRFRQSRTWIEHQIQDAHWTPTAARACYQSLLPGAIINEAPTADVLQVMWQRPAVSQAAPRPSVTVPAASPVASPERLIPVGRTYPRPAPAGYVPFPRSALDGSVIARFEEQVKRHEAKIAVCTATEQISYGDLNSTANRWARRLLGCADAATAPVAILMDQDDPVIPAIFGTLKAGKAYVVIDPADPSERQARILALTGATSLLTTAARVQQATQWQPAPHQLLIAEEIAHDPDRGNLGLPLGPDQLAAIFFTSGSTGEPKGIARDHRQFLHSTWLNTNTYYVAPEDRQSLLYFPGFTASVPNIYDTLLNGATLCSLNPRHLAPADLLTWLQREAISHFNPPIGLFRGLLEAMPPHSRWPHLRLITLAGQPLYGKDVRDCQARFGADTVLLYVLAMTEAGALTQAYLDPTTSIGDGPVPAGYPLPDKTIAILDEDERPTLPGEIGQIAVTSAYLSLGYWHDHAQTQQRYRAVPGDDQQRTFFTGDRGRFDANGALLFYGRADFIVKVRGYRVDLSAIETLLNSHPDVQSAFMVAQPRAHAEPLLVAYLLPRNGQPNQPTALHAFLAQRLPPYMLPDRFVVLDKVPLTASGKVDRQALPLPGNGRPPLQTPFVAPRTSLERTLAALWATLLDLDEVGVEDNFFDLGGHSLLVMQLLYVVEQQLQQRMDLKQFIFQPTIAHLAAALAAAPADEEEAQITNQLGGELDAQPTDHLRALYEQLANGADFNLFVQKVRAQERSQSRLATWLNRLPLVVATQFLQRAVQLPWLRERYFARPTNIVRRFLAGFEPPMPQKALVERCLFFGALIHYDVRNRLFDQLWANQAIQIENLATLHAAQAEQRGVILVTNHSYTLPYLRRLRLAQDGIRNIERAVSAYKLDQSTAERILYTHQLELVRQKLQQGETIFMGPDANRGRGPTLSFALHGRHREFRTGFAELALLTEATVLFVAADVRTHNDFSLHLIGPFDPGSPTTSHAVRVRLLMAQYVDQLRLSWAQAPWSVPWWVMQAHVACPPAVTARNGTRSGMLKES